MTALLGKAVKVSRGRMTLTTMTLPWRLHSPKIRRVAYQTVMKMVVSLLLQLLPQGEQVLVPDRARRSRGRVGVPGLPPGIPSLVETIVLHTEASKKGELSASPAVR